MTRPLPPALVLTAGLGTRLDPLTRLVAKPAVPIAGITLVERVLAWLRREGVDRAVLNLHHRPSTITSVVGDGAHLGLAVRYSWEAHILGSAGGPRHALPLLATDTFLIVNGDTLTDLPLAPIVEAHQASAADVTMAVIANPAPDAYTGVLARDDHAVTAFIPRGHHEPSWHFVGVQVVNARIFEGLDDGIPAETVAGIYRTLLATPGRIRIFPVRAAFLDVGTPRDYLRTVRDLADAGESSIIEGVADIAASARLSRSVVWAGARIGAGVRLVDCIVLSGTNVPAETTATAKILTPLSLVRDGDRAERRGAVALFDL